MVVVDTIAVVEVEDTVAVVDMAVVVVVIARQHLKVNLVEKERQAEKTVKKDLNSLNHHHLGVLATG